MMYRLLTYVRNMKSHENFCIPICLHTTRYTQILSSPVYSMVWNSLPPSNIEKGRFSLVWDPATKNLTIQGQVTGIRAAGQVNPNHIMCPRVSGVFLGNPKDSGREDWGTLGKIRGITTPGPLRSSEDQPPHHTGCHLIFVVQDPNCVQRSKVKQRMYRRSRCLSFLLKGLCFLCSFFLCIGLLG